MNEPERTDGRADGRTDEGREEGRKKGNHTVEEELVVEGNDGYGLQLYQEENQSGGANLFCLLLVRKRFGVDLLSSCVNALQHVNHRFSELCFS